MFSADHCIRCRYPLRDYEHYCQRCGMLTPRVLLVLIGMWMRPIRPNIIINVYRSFDAQSSLWNASRDHSPHSYHHGGWRSPDRLRER